MSQTRTKTRARTKQAHARTTKAAGKGEDARGDGNGQQTRGARPAQARPEEEALAGEVEIIDIDSRDDVFLGEEVLRASADPPKAERPRFALPKVERPQKDLEAALKVLARVGTNAERPEIKMVGEFFVNVESSVAATAAEYARVEADYQAILRSLEGVRLQSPRGRRIRDSLLGTLKAERLTPEEEAAGRIREGRAEGPIPMPAKKRRGRPIEATFNHAIWVLGPPLKWSWQEIAAALYVSGVDRRDYSAIKKSFRDAARRLARR